jgi:hypothetical protein
MIIRSCVLKINSTGGDVLAISFRNKIWFLKLEYSLLLRSEFLGNILKLRIRLSTYKSSFTKSKYRSLTYQRLEEIGIIVNVKFQIFVFELQ